MARRPRLQLNGAIYHVMSRGNRKSQIYDDAIDRQRFLDIVAIASERYEVRVLADVEMDNHYHLVLDTPRGTLSAAMRYINGVYTQHVNRRHRRTGHVFEGRFTSRLVDSDLYLRTVVRYVAMNPVVAGLVTNPEDWAWSSYRATAGLAKPHPFLHLDWMEWVFGCGSRAAAQALYRAFVKSPEATNDATGADVVGSAAFESAVRRHIGESMAHIALPRAYRSLARPPVEELFKDVGFSRNKRDAMIRRAHVVHGYRLSEIAEHLGLHPNSMSKVLRRLKSLRHSG
ncbi:MAG: transposase [Vicinamibacterales bacterium]|jgi:REP element-mobilizing transposase RayT